MEPSLNPATISSILNKTSRDSRASTRGSLSTLTFEQLSEVLTSDELNTVRLLQDINPDDLGFRGPFITLDGPPQNLVRIDGQVFSRNGQSVHIAAQTLPAPAWQAFQAMQRAIDTDIGSRLMVESGYRSPANQALTFLTYLELFNYDLQYVAGGVALPGYSQHGDPVNTAIDVITQDGIPTDEMPQLFADTKEFRWLEGNAAEFGFTLSYPENNRDGVRFEPWHWRYNG